MSSSEFWEGEKAINKANIKADSIPAKGNIKKVMNIPKKSSYINEIWINIKANDNNPISKLINNNIQSTFGAIIKIYIPIIYIYIPKNISGAA